MKRGRLGAVGVLVVTAGLSTPSISFSVIANMQSKSVDATETDALNGLADRYVKLVLALGQHDADYVDAYYGPPEWRAAAEAAKQTVTSIGSEAQAVAGELRASTPRDDADELVRQRHRYLIRQIEALQARAAMLSGKKLTFDEESRALYDAVAPTHTPEELTAAVDQLSAKIPGHGPVSQRYDAFRKRFIIPPARLDATFKAAINECRTRTLQHIALPSDESFTVEYVTQKSWSGYNWYQGNYRSVIQVNTDLPIYIDRALDLACHEGYPGHHVYNALLEKNFVRDRGWVEFSIYALFSPQSLIAEGTANYGIEVAFPGDERTVFEREVLYPEAGLDQAQASTYTRIRELVQRLDYAGNEAARKYLNGQLDRSHATQWLTEYAMMSPSSAEKRTRFFDAYRSYVINYNLGKDLVQAYVESRMAGSARPSARWDEFVRLLASPRLPSALRTPASP
jgi:hypothetical protein